MGVIWLCAKVRQVVVVCIHVPYYSLQEELQVLAFQ